MNDFAEQVNRFVRRKKFPGRVGEVNGAFDAVAKAEFLRELDGEVAGGEHVAVGADAFDELAAIMREDLRLHGFHDIGPAEVDFLGSGRWC